MQSMEICQAALHRFLDSIKEEKSLPDNLALIQETGNLMQMLTTEPIAINVYALMPITPANVAAIGSVAFTFFFLWLQLASQPAPATLNAVTVNVSTGNM